MKWIFLFLAGGFGTLVRFTISFYAINFLGQQFPFGTLAVNIIGSFLSGFIIPLAVDILTIHPEFKFYFVTGFLGGLTTFSGFSFESIELFTKGEYLKAGLYVFMMLGTCSLASIAGIYLAMKQ